MKKILSVLFLLLLLATRVSAQTSGSTGLNISGSPPLPVGQGGTNLSTATDDNVMVGNGTTWQSKVLTTCTGAGKAVTYDAATNTWGCNTIAGGAGANFEEVSVPLGTSGGLVFSATVAATWVTATSKIVCSPFATSADGQTVETYPAAAFEVNAATLVAGASFDLWISSPRGATGTFRFHCTGA